jgi:hypothetical protein
MYKPWLKTIAAFFLGVFMYNTLINGVVLGVAKTCVTWSLFVVATPFPFGGILLGNVFTNFPMAHTQIIATVVALIMLWYWPNDNNIYNVLIQPYKYSIYATCITASVLISYMIKQKYAGKSFDWRLWIVVAALLGLYGTFLVPSILAHNSINI